VVSLLRIAGGDVEGAGRLHLTIPDWRLGSALGERGGGTRVAGGAVDGGAGLEAIEGQVLREMRARHGGLQCARVGVVVGVAALGCPDRQAPGAGLSGRGLEVNEGVPSGRWQCDCWMTRKQQEEAARLGGSRLRK